MDKSYLAKFMRFQEEAYYLPRISFGTYFSTDPKELKKLATKYNIKDPESVRRYIRTEDEAKELFKR